VDLEVVGELGDQGQAQPEPPAIGPGPQATAVVSDHHPDLTFDI
jgi:hypothetical protein